MCGLDLHEVVGWAEAAFVILHEVFYRVLEDFQTSAFFREGEWCA